MRETFPTCRKSENPIRTAQFFSAISHRDYLGEYPCDKSANFKFLSNNNCYEFNEDISQAHKHINIFVPVIKFIHLFDKISAIYNINVYLHDV